MPDHALDRRFAVDALLPSATRLTALARHAGKALRRRIERRRTRRHLSQLDDRELRDIGLSRQDVDREMARSFRFHRMFRDPPVSFWP